MIVEWAHEAWILMLLSCIAGVFIPAPYTFCIGALGVPGFPLIKVIDRN